LPFELAEEEGCALGSVASAFTIAERIYGVDKLWVAVDSAKIDENLRIALYREIAVEMRAHMADVIRNAVAGRGIADTIQSYSPFVKKLSTLRHRLLPKTMKQHTEDFGARLLDQGAPKEVVDQIVRLAQLDGAIGLGAIASAKGHDVEDITQAFTRLGDALGLGWAQGVAMQMDPEDPWERLLVASLARDFQTIRFEFLKRRTDDRPAEAVEKWLADNKARADSFHHMVEGARQAAAPTPAMLAQIAGQARNLLG
jgi:glutamate dehydrogenase